MLPGLLDDDPARLGVTAGASAEFIDALRESGDLLGVALDIEAVTDRAAGEHALRAGELDALLLGRDELVFESEERPSLSAIVNRAVQAISLPQRLNELGLTFEQARPLFAPDPLPVDLLDPPSTDAVTAAERADDDERQLVATGSGLLLLVAIVFYGGWVLKGVVEEKESRVVEVLLGTVRPAVLLAGKVLGILVVAMSQLLAGVAAVGVALLLVGGARIPAVAIDVAAVSALWFVLGLLFYNFAFAAVGATVSRLADAESATLPLGMVLVVPYFLSVFVVPENPDGLPARVLSLVPVTAPLAMPARVAYGEPALWELVFSAALMIPVIVGMVWLAGRIYAGAILRTGPRVGLLQAFRSSDETR
jgi:ABC-2 type transport system permease protein